jgi:hypothetical protein
MSHCTICLQQDHITENCIYNIPGIMEMLEEFDKDFKDVFPNPDNKAFNIMLAFRTIAIKIYETGFINGKNKAEYERG